MPVLIIAAMRLELTPTIKALGARRRRIDRFDLFDAPPLMLVAGGIGVRVGQDLMRLVTDVSPDAVLSTGFVGALDRQLRTGDVILGGTANAPADERLVARAAHAFPRVRIGAVVTVPRVIVGPAERVRILQTDPQAIAVDMESDTIGSIARACGLPFMVARVVLDTVDTPLACRYEGLGEVAAEVMRRPSVLGGIVGDVRRGRRAATDLARFFAAYGNALGDTHRA